MVNGMTREHLHKVQCSILETTFTPCLTTNPFSLGTRSLTPQTVLLLFRIDNSYGCIIKRI